MRMSGQRVVVTGAAGGIGKALARRLVVGGARVVVNDLDEEATKQAATEVGGFAVSGDAASVEGVGTLVEGARAHLGEIDVWFGNAGVSRGFGLHASESDWSANWQVNTMAHVRAAQLLVPAWLERGAGRFVLTASAAGLLTALDLATYSVTKHGAVAFAEWLSATYRHRGIVVQVICPLGVKTGMLDQTGRVREIIAPEAVSPEVVAQVAWEALGDERFFVLPQPEAQDHYRRRATDTDRWLAGMNGVQRRLEASHDGSGAKGPP